MAESHYLKEELYKRVASDPSIFDFLQNGSLDGLWYWDIEHPEHEWMNERFWELLGYDPKEKKHLAKEWQDLINQDDLKKALENFQKHCEDPNHPYDQVVRYRHANGKTIWVRCRGIAIRDENGKPIRMLGAHNDLTEQKELEMRLREQAGIDELTGIANRRAFEEHIIWCIGNMSRSSKMLSLAIVDIDFFKGINDEQGHLAGDDVLRAIGETIKQACRLNDYPARYGGDEFVVVLHDTGIDESLLVGQRLREEIAESKESVTVSIGISTLFPATAGQPRELMKQLFDAADQALYMAKTSGRNRVVHSERLSSLKVQE